MQLSRRSLALGLAATCLAPSISGANPIKIKIDLKTYKPFLFQRALVKAIRSKLHGARAARFLRALRKRLYATTGQQTPVTGYQYAYGQCCGILVANESPIQRLWATLEAMYAWIIENWQTVLRILISVLSFVVI